jgi:hypothetical protein
MTTDLTPTLDDDAPALAVLSSSQHSSGDDSK